MAKFTAPADCTGISVGGEQFDVGEDGTITVPEGFTAEGVGAIVAAGFTAVVDKPKKAAPAPTPTPTPAPAPAAE